MTYRTYKDLRSFQQAEIVYDFTVEFCARYVDTTNKTYRSYKSRMYDQMVQAARSGKQNIVEGCSVSKTSPKNELFLLGVARGSLKELLEDYEDFLRQKSLKKWEKEDERAQEVRRIPYKSDRMDKTYRAYLDYPERAANAMITLINQTTYLLDQQIKAVQQQMEEKGIAREPHEQKLRRIMNEDKKKNEEFDAYLQEIVEKGRKKDKLDKSDKMDMGGRQRGFMKSRVMVGIGMVVGVVVLIVVGVGYWGDKSATSYTSDRSDTSQVFSSSVSPIISLGISVAEAQALPQGIKLIESNIEITGPRNERINDALNLELKAQDNGEYGLVMNPKDEQAFRPGKYSVSADIQTNSGIRHITQDFLWGVLALNPNKPIYRPGETANIALAVLDEKGMMVCDADVRLGIRAPDMSYKMYRSHKSGTSDRSDGTIRVNEECRLKKVTQRPDYETEYTVSAPGTYQMTLTATTKNGTYTIEDWFEVVDSALRQAQGDNYFDIERISATRIYPVHEYPVTIEVTPLQDFKGTVEEVVPASFGVREADDTTYRANRSDKSYMTYRSYMTDTSDKVIAWQVDWNAGETYELSYIYKSPEISPQFYLLGPLRFYRSDKTDKTYTTYEEARQWQVAVDTVEFNDTFTETVATALGSNTPETGGGYTALVTVGTCTLYTSGVSDNLNAPASVGTGGCGASEGEIYRTNSQITSANYIVSVTMTNGDTQDDTNMIACRIQDSSNMYAVWFNEADIDLYEKVSNTWSIIATGAPTPPASGSVITLRCEGTIISVQDDGAEVYSVTDTSHSAAGYAGIGMGGVIIATDDVSSQQLDNFQVDTIVVNSPTITSVTDSPDPATALRSTVSFSTDWNDADGGETIKVKICKTNSLTSQNCDGGYWATSSAFTTTDPEIPTYGVEGSAVGSQSYYAFVCDNDGNCSSSTSGTFTVNPTTVPNVKFR